MFFISAPELRQPSGKPKHLKIRFENKDINLDSITKVTARRIEILHQRTEAIRSRFEVFEKRLKSRKLEYNDYMEHLVSDISKNMDNATKSRTCQLNEMVSRAEKENKKAKEIADRTSLEKKQRLKKLEDLIITKDLISFWRRAQMQGKWSHMNKIKDPVEMTNTINNWWRFCSSKSVLMQLSTILEDADSKSFEEMTELINTPVVLDVCKKLFNNLNIQSNNSVCIERVFLSVLVICYHEDRAFVTVSERELKLKKNALLLIQVFQGLIHSTNHNIFKLYAISFKHAWVQYQTEFEEWKANDKQEMIELMINHFIELSKIWESVKGDENAEEEWRPKLIQNQNHILSKLNRFAGKPGLKTLHTEMDKLGLQKVQRNNSTVVIPTVNVRALKTPESPIEIEQVPKNATKLSTFADQYMLDEKENINFYLAHEIMVDPDFRFENSANSMTQQTRLVTRKAFIDICKSDAIKKDYKGLLDILKSVKNNLLEIAPQSGHHRSVIEEVMDMDLLQQQASSDYFETRFPTLISFVLETMGQFCSPNRDADMAHIALEADSFNKLEMILNVMDLLKLDLANFHTQALRGLLKDQVLTYEREMFAKQNFGLETTTSWLNSHKQEDLGFSDVFDNAFVALFFDKLTNDTFPETMLMDSKRIKDLELTTTSIVHRCVIFNLLKPHMTAPDRVKLPQVYDAFDLPMDDTLPVTFMALLKSFEIKLDFDVLTKICEATLRKNVPIFSILNRRMSTIFKEILDQGKIKSRLASFGLELFHEELSQICKKIFYLYKHNKRVYGPIYDDILRK